MTRVVKISLSIIIISIALLLPSQKILLAAQSVSYYFGRYTGSVEAVWLPGRKMRLLKEIEYTDPNDLVWIAPKGAEIDGASIPKFLWSIIGGPFSDNYRQASVIHDVYCESKIRTWEVTHLAFYYAMRASGVDDTQAKIMYAGVYFFGPRWSIRKVETISAKSLSESLSIPEAVNFVVNQYEQYNPESTVNLENAFMFDGDISNNFNQFIELEFTVSPKKKNILDISDFESLKRLIEEGKTEDGNNGVTLEEIRSYSP